MMLHYSNLQFTNATQLNDPFDCHPSLIDFSNVPKEACGGWTPEIIEELRRDPFRRTREEVWVCSLSKIYDSILMWSYYSKHKGICIGLDMESHLLLLFFSARTTLIRFSNLRSIFISLSNMTTKISII